MAPDFGFSGICGFVTGVSGLTVVRRGVIGCSFSGGLVGLPL